MLFVNTSSQQCYVTVMTQNSWRHFANIFSNLLCKHWQLIERNTNVFKWIFKPIFLFSVVTERDGFRTKVTCLRLKGQDPQRRHLAGAKPPVTPLPYRSLIKTPHKWAKKHSNRCLLQNKWWTNEIDVNVVWTINQFSLSRYLNWSKSREDNAPQFGHHSSYFTSCAQNLGVLVDGKVLRNKLLQWSNKHLPLTASIKNQIATFKLLKHFNLNF